MHDCWRLVLGEGLRDCGLALSNSTLMLRLLVVPLGLHLVRDALPWCCFAFRAKRTRLAPNFRCLHICTTRLKASRRRFSVNSLSFGHGTGSPIMVSAAALLFWRRIWPCAGCTRPPSFLRCVRCTMRSFSALGSLFRPQRLWKRTTC